MMIFRQIVKRKIWHVIVISLIVLCKSVGVFHSKEIVIDSKEQIIHSGDLVIDCKELVIGSEELIISNNLYPGNIKEDVSSINHCITSVEE